jgi:hypothetical protein
VQTQPLNPLPWLVQFAASMQWPIVVAAAFWVGRWFQKIEARMSKAEKSITSLTERHMPAIHRALSEIRGMLSGGKNGN